MAVGGIERSVSMPAPPSRLSAVLNASWVIMPTRVIAAAARERVGAAQRNDVVVKIAAGDEVDAVAGDDVELLAVLHGGGVDAVDLDGEAGIGEHEHDRCVAAENRR